jgi:hypothetical protein
VQTIIVRWKSVAALCVLNQVNEWKNMKEGGPSRQLNVDGKLIKETGSVGAELLLLLLLLLKPHFTRICNLYIYIQQTGVRIGCNGLGNGTH